MYLGRPTVVVQSVYQRFEIFEWHRPRRTTSTSISSPDRNLRQPTPNGWRPVSTLVLLRNRDSEIIDLSREHERSIWKGTKVPLHLGGVPYFPDNWSRKWRPHWEIRYFLGRLQNLRVWSTLSFFLEEIKHLCKLFFSFDQMILSFVTKSGRWVDEKRKFLELS